VASHPQAPQISLYCFHTLLTPDTLKPFIPPGIMPILEWSAIQPRVELSTMDDFDHAIDRLSARCTAERPSIVALYAHGHQVILGLGLPESFVQIQEGDDPHHGPALVTVGDPTAHGEVAFYLLGSHLREIPRRHLIPTLTARRLARQFLESGKLSDEVAWEAA